MVKKENSQKITTETREKLVRELYEIKNGVETLIDALRGTCVYEKDMTVSKIAKLHLNLPCDLAEVVQDMRTGSVKNHAVRSIINEIF